LINKLEMDLRSYIYRMLGDNEEHLHCHDLFSNAYSARGVLNQHPAIGYSHPLDTERTFDNDPFMCRAKR
jgi:hypothetical protein